MNNEHTKTILLVEDEVLIAMTEKMQLEKYGYNVHHVTTGKEAVQTIVDKTLAVDLILMDINLGSGIDGTQAAEEILKEKDIPIVFLSSHTEPEVVEKTEKITSYGYVVKNSGIVVLDASIKMALKLFDAKCEQKQAEERIKFLSDITEKINDSLIVTDTHFAITYLNQAAERLFGYTLDEVRGKTPEFLNADPMADQVQQELYATISSGKTYTTEAINMRKDGSTFICEFKVMPLKDEQGRIVSSVGVQRDITARKQMEEALRESEERFRKSFDTEVVAIAISRRRDGMYIEANPGFLKVTGYDYNEIVGHTSQELGFLSPSQRQTLIANLEEKGRLHNQELTYPTRSGELRTILFSIGPITIDNEDCMLATMVDITARKRAEEEIRSQNTLLSILMETSPIGITTVDTTGNITYANTRAEEILGLVKDEITSRTYDAPVWNHTDLDGSPLPDEKQPFNIVKTIMRTVYNIQHGITWPDGRVVLLSINASPMKDVHGNFTGMVATIEDVTDAKKQEDLLRKQLTEKETLLREVHHRVKNNIANIESLLTLQENSTDSLEAKEAIQGALSRVQSMRILYEKLLLSKEFCEISIKHYLDDLIDSLQHVFVGRDTIIIEKHISDFNIISKHAFFLGIIINELLTNVFKYAFKNRDQGTASITLEKTEHTVTLTIHDNGIGIDERIMDNKSPGFGLTIVNMLVEQLHGTYRVANENGTKSVIQFEI